MKFTKSSQILPLFATRLFYISIMIKQWNDKARGIRIFSFVALAIFLFLADNVTIQAEEQAGTDGKTAPFNWKENVKLKGDFRLRYQYKHGDSGKILQQPRIRMRAGLEAKFYDWLAAGAGVATSPGGDPRSRNLAFGPRGSAKTAVLDYAFARYSPFDWISAEGGRMLLPDVIWNPTDFVWDTDITPEGGVLALNKEIASNFTVFLRTGFIIIDDSQGSQPEPPSAYFVQPAAVYDLSEKISLKAALSFEDFDNVKGHVSSRYSAATNTGNTTKGVSRYTYNYGLLNPAVELSLKEPFSISSYNIESLKLFAEFVDNLDVSKGSDGFALGFRLGKNRISGFGDWGFRYLYIMLEKDAALDLLPDSDRYSGKTGIRSNEVELVFGLTNNTFLGLDIYRSWKTGDPKSPETLVQFDWNIKF